MIKNVLTYSLAVFLFGSCRKENAVDCFKPNGDVITETRYPGEFTKIEMNDKIEVTVFQGPGFKVEVQAGKNIIKNISTRVSDGLLKIENKNTCNFVRGYKKHIRVKVTLPELHSVLNNGVYSLIIDEDFKQDSINIRAESSGDIHLNGTYGSIKAHSNGNGDVYIKGKCNSLSVFINGTNFLRAEELTVNDYAYIETLSMGDCYFNATALKKFEYYIWGEGSIYYRGEPGTMSGVLDAACKGKVIKKD